MSSKLPGLFVTGTDTGVGKTRIAAGIASTLASRGAQVAVLKPLASGASRHGDVLVSEDALALISAVGGDVPTERVSPLTLELPLAPNVAALLSAVPLDREIVIEAVRQALDWWSDRADVVVVEGVGGILCPLADDFNVLDLASELDLPIVVVARRSLGTLNHSALSVEAARRRGLRLAGVVLNSPEPSEGGLAERTNSRELTRLMENASIPILAEVGHQATLDERHDFGGLGDVPWELLAARARWPLA